MTENQRRQADRVTARDLVVRIVSAIGLVAAALAGLLAAQPF